MGQSVREHATTIGGLLVLGGAIAVAVSVTQDLFSAEQSFGWGPDTGLKFIVAGVAVAVAAEWVLVPYGIRRGVSVLAFLGTTAVWFVSELVSPEASLYLHLSPWWVIAFAVYALFACIGIVGALSETGRLDRFSPRLEQLSTAILVGAAALVVYFALDPVFVGPPEWIRMEVYLTGKLFAAVAAGIAIEWVSFPRGWTRTASALFWGSGLVVYFWQVVLTAHDEPSTAGFAAFFGSVAIVLGGVVAEAGTRAFSSTAQHLADTRS